MRNKHKYAGTLSISTNPQENILKYFYIQYANLPKISIVFYRKSRPCLTFCCQWRWYYQVWYSYIKGTCTLQSLISMKMCAHFYDSVSADHRNLQSAVSQNTKPVYLSTFSVELQPFFTDNKWRDKRAPCDKRHTYP